MWDEIVVLAVLLYGCWKNLYANWTLNSACSLDGDLYLNQKVQGFL
jgi:hypothetical protein